MTEVTGPIKFRSFAVASNGDNSLVAAVTGKKIRVLALDATAAGAVAVKFRSATTDISGAQALPANGQKILPFNPVGWYETVAGEALQVNLGGAVSFAGGLVYQEVP